MQLIQTVTVGSGGAASITFGSGGTIPQTYTDLLIVVSARADGSGYAYEVSDTTLFFNTSSANFTYRTLFGDGSSPATDTTAHNFTTGANATANTFGSMQFYIPNYTSSNNKSFSVDSVTEHNGTITRQLIAAGLWSQTAAITEIKLAPAINAWVQYSSASLYGITKGSDGIVTVS